MGLRVISLTVISDSAVPIRESQPMTLRSQPHRSPSRTSG